MKSTLFSIKMCSRFTDLFLSFFSSNTNINGIENFKWKFSNKVIVSESLLAFPKLCQFLMTNFKIHNGTSTRLSKINISHACCAKALQTPILHGSPWLLNLHKEVDLFACRTQFRTEWALQNSSSANRRNKAAPAAVVPQRRFSYGHHPHQPSLAWKPHPTCLILCKQAQDSNLPPFPLQSQAQETYTEIMSFSSYTSVRPSHSYWHCSMSLKGRPINNWKHKELFLLKKIKRQ